MRKQESMKKRYLKHGLFLLGALLLVVLIDVLSVWDVTDSYVAKVTDTDMSRYGPGEVEPALEIVKSEDETSVLLLGDSVANQLFEGLIGANEAYCITPVNRAITVAGQYILIREYLDHHADATDVYLVVIPDTLASTIDEKLAYQYVAMPFIENGYEDDLNETVMQELKAQYGKLFLQKEVLYLIDHSGINRKLYFHYRSDSEKQSEWAPLFGSGAEDEEGEKTQVLSEISADYLEKIHLLCEERGVKVHLLTPPVADTKNRHEEQAQLASELKEHGLDRFFPDYCSGFLYYPEEMFSDGIHFKEEYKNRDTMNPIIEKMILQSEDLSGLSSVFGSGL